MSAAVLEWYQGVRTTVVDLVGDYAGKELFLLEGDSLLLECFQDKRIDFEGGFQLLHAIFVVETFLENLIKRKCNFQIVFFDANAKTCIPLTSKQPARYLLARSVIIRHLSLRVRSRHPDFEIHTFLHFRCDPFLDYLNTASIYFVMCHDGSQLKVSKISDLEKSDSDMEETATPVNETAILFRLMIYWFTSRGFNISLINEIHWRDTKIMARVVESNHSLQPRMRKKRSSHDAASPQMIAPSITSHTRNLDKVLHLVSGRKTQFSEREYLGVYCLSTIEHLDVWYSPLAAALLLHLSCLSSFSMSDRRFRLFRCSEENDEFRLQSFVNEYSKIAKRTLEDPRWIQVMRDQRIKCDIEDLIDGRVLRGVLRTTTEGHKGLLINGPILMKYKELKELMEFLGTRNDAQDLNLSMRFNTSQKDLPVYSSKNLRVLPFANSIFDPHLKSIHIDVDTSSGAPSSERSSVVVREISHWHNARRLLDPKKAIAEKKPAWTKRWNPLRSNQIYMREMVGYAASLTNSKGKQLEPQTITVSCVKQSSTKHASSKPKKDVKSTASKAVEIVAKNKANKEPAEVSRVFAAWDTKKKHTDTLQPEARYTEAGAYINRLDAVKAAILYVDIGMYRLQALLSAWASFCKYGNKENGYRIAALIWDVVNQFRSNRTALTQAAFTQISSVCSLLGLPQLESQPIIPINRPLSFTFSMPLTPRDTLMIGMKPHEFQLLYCGPYMDRNTDPKPDPRVESFQPDGWQRKVLDELDANNSIFVVAPTSAGKTYCIFRAMEMVLRDGNESVLVYVAPSKALVNQIAAEIQGRFSKTYPHAGHSVWAIHTRDYRVNNPSGCQILVTVPHILQIMLLAPSNAKTWAPRVKRIIFDEIHCIGQADDGIIWEQLLLLAPCPIVALSATVGNPEEFYDWLAATQGSIGIKVTMIQHKQRYSDLRKYVYNPPEKFIFAGVEDLGPTNGQLGLDGGKGLRFLHPISSLVNKTRGIPDDLALEPRDCLNLWKSMVKHQTNEFPVPQYLNPETLPPFIRKVDVFAWEKLIKEILLQWMQNEGSPFDKVYEDLTHALNQGGPEVATEQQIQAVPEVIVSSKERNHDVENRHEKRFDSENVETIDPADLSSTILPLLVSLHSQNALPAICFNYDRYGCEKIAKGVLFRLQRAERIHKSTSIAWKKTVEGFQEWKERKEAKNRQKPVKHVKKVKGKGADSTEDGDSRDDMMRDAASKEAHFYDSFDPDEPLDQFTFANKSTCESSSLEADLRALAKKGLAPWLGMALKRGIGVHHAGMNRKYRQIVEMLFRKGFLRVVIATGTLSLGINMPAKTSVFSGDSVYLTALNFRQAAGRAGRRGFDLLGNVVFHGIELPKVCRLLSSRLPDLNGHFPVTTTLVLRLFTLLNESEGAPYAVQAINSLLSQPRLYLGGDSFKAQVLHHLRFSIEYLRKQALLGLNGQPINFAQCVSHLYYTENSSFSFFQLLRGGYFQDLVSERHLTEEKLMHTMLIVMAHLFGRRECRSVESEFIDSVVKKSASIVFLPPMPLKAAAILRQHNKDTLDIFSTYVETFAAQHLHGEERQLPLTKLEVAGEGNAEAAKLLGALPRSTSRSAFVALSGHGDDFESISDLCSSARSGVFLESAVVPHLEVYPEESKMPLNAYIFDFFKHGQLDAIETANGIRKSDVWFLLNDFSLVLATIVTSLANYLHLKDSDDAELIDAVGSGDALEIDADERLADDTVDIAMQEKPKAAAIPPKRTKKGIADSWEDEDDVGEAPKVTQDEKVDGLNVEGSEEWKLYQVYLAFVRLRSQFNEKFKIIWA